MLDSFTFGLAGILILASRPRVSRFAEVARQSGKLELADTLDEIGHLYNTEYILQSELRGNLRYDSAVLALGRTISGVCDPVFLFLGLRADSSLSDCCYRHMA